MQLPRTAGIVLILTLSAEVVSAQDRGLTEGEAGQTLPKGEWRTALRTAAHRQPDGSMLYQPLQFRLDIGISDWVELGLDLDARAIDGQGDFPSSVLDFGDPTWRLKVVPYRSDDWSLGGVLVFKLPTAHPAKGLGTNNGDAHFRLFFTRAWPDWETGLTVGFAALGAPSTAEPLRHYLTWSAWTTWAFAESWTIAAELRGSQGTDDVDNRAEGYLGDPWVTGRLGVQIEWDRWALAIGGEVGLTPETPDWSIFLEISRTWDVGALDPAPGSDETEFPVGLDPLPTRSARTIPEGSFAMIFEGEFRRQADASLLTSFPRLGGAFSLGKSTDFRFWLDFRWLHDSDLFGTDPEAFGDLFVECRWIPFPWEDLGVGLLLGGKLPLSRRDHGTTTGQVDTYARLLLTLTLGDFAFSGNLGIAINNDPGHESRQIDALLWGIATEIRLSPLWIVTVGLDGADGASLVEDVSRGWAGQNMTTVRAAIQTRTPIGSLTLAAGVGITPHSPDWEITLGTTLWLD